MKVVGTVLLTLLLGTQALAFDFYWEGNYSAEGNYFNGVDLGNSTENSDKAYINHHLLLRPEIIFFEGLSFHGALDTINGTGSIPPSSRVGHTLGGDLASASSTYGSDVPEPFLQRQIQKSRGVDISEAYLKYSHTNGELRIGRQPLHFGYGAFYNAGHRPFDHWYTNRDGISYTFSMGSLSFTPMFHFLSSGIETGGQTTEYGLKFNFGVEDTGLDLGFMFLQRYVPGSVNELNPVYAGETGKAEPITYGIFYNRKRKTYRYGFEALFQDGKLSDNVGYKGFGIAAEAEWKPSRWMFSGRFGYAQGDDPNDNSEVSSVALHRNYDLGLILFNHPLGASSYDALGTDIRGRRGALSSADYSSDMVVDTESISNAIYLAPSVGYSFSKQWDLTSTLVFAWLDETSIAGVGDVSSYLGSEVDLTLTYNPTENITYKTTLGFFVPGGAFDGAGTLETKNTFGATTSLGITF